MTVDTTSGLHLELLYGCNIAWCWYTATFFFRDGILYKRVYDLVESRAIQEPCIEGIEEDKRWFHVNAYRLFEREVDEEAYVVWCHLMRYFRLYPGNGPDHLAREQIFKGLLKYEEPKPFPEATSNGWRSSSTCESLRGMWSTEEIMAEDRRITCGSRPW